MEPLLGIAVALAAATALLGGLTLARRYVRGEAARKIAHVGTGGIALALPVLFDEAWPALVVIGLAAAALVAVRSLRPLRETVGEVVHGVKRDSYGEFWLLASIGILFVLSPGGPLYFVPILIVTFADAAAAVIGVGYGRTPYEATEGKKSVEGSVAFFIVAFLSAHVPLLLFTTIGRLESLLLGAILGSLLVLFEGIAWKGLDNLFIPLSAYLLLFRLVDGSAMELAIVLAVVVAMVAFAFVWRRWTTLSAGALFGAVLVGFVLWAVGGWPWLLPAVVVFAAYTLLPPRNDLDRLRNHNVHVVLSVTGAGLAWLFLASIVGDPRLYLPFTAAFAAHLAIIGVVRFRHARPHMKPVAVLGATSLQATLLVLVPYLFIVGVGTRGAIEAGLGLVGVVAAAAAFLVVHYRHGNPPDPKRRWTREAACATIGSLLTLAIFLV